MVSSAVRLGTSSPVLQLALALYIFFLMFRFDIEVIWAVSILRKGYISRFNNLSVVHAPGDRELKHFTNLFVGVLYLFLLFLLVRCVRPAFATTLEDDEDFIEEQEDEEKEDDVSGLAYKICSEGLPVGWHAIRFIIYILTE